MLHRANRASLAGLILEAALPVNAFRLLTHNHSEALSSAAEVMSEIGNRENAAVKSLRDCCGA
jgi:hypothetical protein